MTKHPTFAPRPIWEHIALVAMISDEVTKAEAELLRLFRQASAGDLSVLNAAHEAAVFYATLAAQAAWADGVRCGRNPARLLFADPSEADQSPTAGA